MTARMSLSQRAVFFLNREICIHVRSGCNYLKIFVFCWDFEAFVAGIMSTKTRRHRGALRTSFKSKH